MIARRAFLSRVAGGVIAAIVGAPTLARAAAVYPSARCGARKPSARIATVPMYGLGGELGRLRRFAADYRCELDLSKDEHRAGLILSVTHRSGGNNRFLVRRSPALDGEAQYVYVVRQLRYLTAKACEQYPRIVPT